MRAEFNLNRTMNLHGGRCVTRDGRPARIVCADVNTASGRSLVVLVRVGTTGEESVLTFAADGSYAPGGGAHGWDLITRPAASSWFVEVLRRWAQVTLQRDAEAP
jgi:hypothetical protein